MGRIPQYAIRHLETRAAGVPPPDTSQIDVKTSQIKTQMKVAEDIRQAGHAEAKAISQKYGALGATVAAMGQIADIATRAQKTKKTLEDETAVVASNMDLSRGLYNLGTDILGTDPDQPRSTVTKYQDEANTYIKNFVGGIKDPEQKNAMENLAPRTYQDALNKYNTRVENRATQIATKNFDKILEEGANSVARAATIEDMKNERSRFMNAAALLLPMFSSPKEFQNNMKKAYKDATKQFLENIKYHRSQEAILWAGNGLLDEELAAIGVQRKDYIDEAMAVEKKNINDYNETQKVNDTLFMSQFISSTLGRTPPTRENLSSILASYDAQLKAPNKSDKDKARLLKQKSNLLKFWDRYTQLNENEVTFSPKRYNQLVNKILDWEKKPLEERNSNDGLAIKDEIFNAYLNGEGVHRKHLDQAFRLLDPIIKETAANHLTRELDYGYFFNDKTDSFGVQVPVTLRHLIPESIRKTGTWLQDALKNIDSEIKRYPGGEATIAEMAINQKKALIAQWTRDSYLDKLVEYGATNISWDDKKPIELNVGGNTLTFNSNGQITVHKTRKK